NGNGNYGSGNYTPTAVGTYYWIAGYSGDANNSPASGACGDTGESSVVSKAQPQIVTTATGSVTIGSPISDTATLSGATTGAGGDTGEASVVGKVQPQISTTATGPVTIGSPISDTATLSGATTGAGGTITFHLYSDAACANEITTGLTAKTVSGNGDYGSGTY